MTTKMTKEERQRRHNIAFAIAVLCGILLVAGGLLLAAAYPGLVATEMIVEWKLIVPGLLCLLSAVGIGNKFSYLL
jgi:hypothetical protein